MLTLNSIATTNNYGMRRKPIFLFTKEERYIDHDAFSLCKVSCFHLTGRNRK